MSYQPIFIRIYVLSMFSCSFKICSNTDYFLIFSFLFPHKAYKYIRIMTHRNSCFIGTEYFINPVD